MSSQTQHPNNDIIISGSNDSAINSTTDVRLGYHHSNRHLHHHPSTLNIMNPNNTCPCTHHYHHIHHQNTPASATTPQQQNVNGGHYHHQQSYNNRLISNSTNGCLNHRQSIQSCLTDDNSDCRQISGETHVAVTVHQQSQQQQHHQYQVLDLNEEESTCDCHLGNNHQHIDSNDRNSSRLCLGSGGVGDGESIIPSSSEDSQVHKCIHHRKNKNHFGNQQRRILSRGKGIIKSRENEDDYSSRIEVYSDGADSGVKINDCGTSEEDQGPPLPPRPPPRIRNLQNRKDAPFSTRVKKYVIWCLISGGCSCILGAMFLGVYFLLRSYTSTVGYFETVPTFVPATLLILTGLCIISLARRRNRYSFLIKLSGVCGLASALICALVTVTTTVLHMSRLQALRECEYSTKARTCTCYSTTIEPQLESDGDVVTFVFDSTSDCGLVHGALYSCLRAIFGLSVAGVLVAVFSCMLVYQLLSHERKKMYWEQLELRCRSLYESQQAPPPLPPGPPTGPSIIGPQMAMNTSCRCCEQCHTHRQSMPPSAVYPWDGTNRFWTSAGGQPQPLGNYYSPNPVGDELANTGINVNRNNQNSQGNGNNSGRTSGWSWSRFLWHRNNSNRNNNTANVNDQNSRLFRQSPASPDSQYGFSNNTPGQVSGGPADGNGNNMIANVVQVQNQQGSYSIIGGLPYSVWGPPPPYSDPNSPARRGRYQYIQPNQCPTNMDHQIQPTQQQIQNLECHQHSSSTESHTMEPAFCSPQNRNVIKRQSGFKTKDNYENTPSDSDGPRDRFSNTLPVRKMKKRVEVGAKSIGPNSNANQTAQRVNVQNVFQPIRPDMEEPEYHEPRNPDEEPSDSPTNISSNSSSSAGTQSNCQQSKMKRVKIGIENSGFQNAENENIKNNAVVRIMAPSTESEVYFADVSSCCNISVKNDNYYDDANKRRPENCDSNSTAKEENEDYLAQRFGKRENSIRSRLPFPQIITGNENYDKNHMNLPIITPRQSLIPKDLSRQSMCSVDSGEKTDFTDLSPATPCSNFTSQVPSSSQQETIESTGNTNFVATYPFSSNEQSQEAHRRSTKNIHELFLAPDAQYEIVKDSDQYESQPLTAFEQEMSFINNNNNNNNSNNNINNSSNISNNNNINNNNNKSSTTSHSHTKSSKSSKNLNLTPIKRTNLGTNITSIIQNLSSSDSGLLYPESPADQENQENKLNSQQQLQQKQQQTVIGTALSNSDNEWSDSSDRRL